jgi:hypothetical protein
MEHCRPGSTAAPANTAKVIQAIRRIQTQIVQVQGCNIHLLDAIHIFKGKLHSTADQSEVSDTGDLVYLEASYRSTLQASWHLFSLLDVGKSVKGYPDLPVMFARLQVNVQEALRQASSRSEEIQISPPYDVQKAIIE